MLKTGFEEYIPFSLFLFSVIWKFVVDWQVLQEAEYKAWLTEHTVAETSIENREELLLESAQRLETNLTLLGKALK